MNSTNNAPIIVRAIAQEKRFEQFTLKADGTFYGSGSCREAAPESLPIATFAFLGGPLVFEGRTYTWTTGPNVWD